jgi:uncharacterized protein (TIGR02118 family)
MVKLIAFIKHLPGMSREAFYERWVEHTKLSSQMPGLLGYRINVAIPQQPDGGEPLYDGTAELWWNSLEEMEACFETEIAKEAGADADTFCTYRVHLYTEETVIIADKMPR